MKTSLASHSKYAFKLVILLAVAFSMVGSVSAMPWNTEGQIGTVAPTPAAGPLQSDGPAGGGIDVALPVIPVQGKLTDSGGAPINGSRTLTLSLYNLEAAVTPICSQSTAVFVTNGLFNALLQTCSADQVYGEKLWLGITVQGDVAEMTPRQPVYAVPYAISLVPGASVTQSSSTIYTLSLTNTAGADVLQLKSGYGNFINAQTTLNDPRFVVKNGGEIWSKAVSKVAVSPLSGVATDPTRLVLSPRYYNSLWVKATVTGTSEVVIPVDVPMQLYGSPLELAGARVCYITENSLNYINQTAVRMIYEGGSYDDLAIDATIRNATGGNLVCFDLMLGPSTHIVGALMIYFRFNFANAADQIHLGSITLTLADQ